LNTSVSALNTFTASQSTASLVTSINNLNTFSASALVSISNINSTTASLNTSITNLNLSSASQQVSIDSINSVSSSWITESETSSFARTNAANLFTADQTIASANNLIVSGSLVSLNGLFIPAGILNTSIQFSSPNSTLRVENASLNVDNTLTASLQEGYAWVGNGSGRTTTVPTSSFGGGSVPAGTVSSSAQITSLGFVSSSVTASSLITASVSLNTITFTKGDGTTFPITVNTGSGGGGGSTDTGSLLVTASVSVTPNTITFTKGDASTFDVTLNITASASASFDTGSFATTGSNTFRGTQTIATGNLVMGNGFTISAPSGAITNLSAASTIQFITEPPAGPGGINDIKFINRVSGSSIIFENTQGGAGNRIDLTGGELRLTAVTQSGSNGNISLTTNTGSISLTTSAEINLRGAVKIKSKNDNNTVTVLNSSGSLLFTPNNSTTASLHLLQSNPGNTVNLVFKNNNNTPTTIISGSNNIFQNPSAATAGFNRYMSRDNIFNEPQAIPQISQSMAFSPSINANIGALQTTIRGPVSASAWSVNYNIGTGLINIGQSAALNAEKLTAGVNVNGNYLGFNSGIFISATQTHLTGSNTSIGGNVMASSVILQISSSAVNFNTNYVGSGTTIRNAFFSQSLGLGTVSIGQNQFVGGSTIELTGSQAAGTTNAVQVNNNIVGGGNNVLYPNTVTPQVSGSNAYHHLARTFIFGENLVITGSSLLTDTKTLGSAFIGRFGANDGIRNRTSDTVFSVGTGTSGSAGIVRKTGFLIDSGSNTYVEGTLNVSGSTSLTGSLYIKSGSWIPSATGSSLLTWNSTTGQVAQSTFTNLFSASLSVGAFSSLVTQSGSAGVSQSVNFDTTDISSGVSIASNSRITLANSGTYSLTFSAQIKADGGQDTVWMWLKKNGTNVPNTSTKIVGKNNEETVLTVNYVVDAVATDYYELAWENLNGYGDLLYEVAGTNYPAIPSVILTVTQVK
jgi:hypothetical protein